jgi:hypothetical protein
MPRPSNDSPNTSSAPPSRSRRCHGTHRPKPSSTARLEAGAPSAFLNSFLAPTLWLPFTNTFLQKASRLSATTGPTVTKPGAYVNRPITLTKASTPRAPPSTVRWVLDAYDGTVVDLEPENAAAWMPTAPRYKRERPEPAGVTATVSLQAVEMQQLDNDLMLVIEDPDPWAQGDEPIFWTD